MGWFFEICRCREGVEKCRCVTPSCLAGVSPRRGSCLLDDHLDDATQSLDHTVTLREAVSGSDVQRPDGAGVAANPYGASYGGAQGA